MKKSKYADDVELLGGVKTHTWYLSANDVRYMRKKARRKISPAEARAAVEQLNEVFGF